MRILNAAGKDVSGFAYTADYRFPVSAEPGKTFSTPFTWEQRDCSGVACVQVPAGTYTVVADWTERVRQHLAEHVVAAQSLTGLPLPGPPKAKSHLTRG